MQRVSFSFFASLLLVLFCCSISVGQAPSSAPRYDPGKVISFVGRIEKIGTVKSPVFNRYGLHFIVRDIYSAVYFLHLCPQWYADEHPEQFNFKENDLIAVVGSRFASKVTENNVYPAAITNYSQNFAMLSLRNPQTGDPLWSNQPKDIHDRVQAMQKFAFTQKSQLKQREMTVSVPGQVMRSINQMQIKIK
jgi:hypothetical protein